MDQRNLLMADSEFLHHEPCPQCGSKDNLGRFTDGHGHCFGCGYYEKGESMAEAFSGTEGSTVTSISSTQSPKQKGLLTEGTYEALRKRRISEETCKFWGYQIGHFKGKTVQIANYFDLNRKRVAQKIRFPNKDFLFLGEPKQAPLYGQWLWRDSGKMVVITEGELDAITVSHLQNNKWPVVSVNNGSSGAHKNIQKALEWLCKFERVIFMFDQDEPGRKAVEECVHLLPPGKAYVAQLPLKDASEMHQAGRGSEVIDAIWGAKEWRPDGIVNAHELFDEMMEDDTGDSIEYPWVGLTETTRGLRRGELVTFCAGSGIGKSTACREIAHWLLKKGERLGYIALEESVKITLKSLVGIEINQRLSVDMSGASKEELRSGFDNVIQRNNLYLYNHFGSMDSERLINHLRYLAKGMGVNWIILDHITIVVSGDDKVDDERRALDVAMTKLRSLVEETGLGLILVSHLKRPDGKGYGEGAKVSLNQLRGSAAIEQLSDVVIGMERNQQDAANKNRTTIRVLKNRFTGEVGESCFLAYNKDTGRLTEEEGLFDEFENSASSEY